MRRLTSWFRRPRPTVGGPAAPIPDEYQLALVDRAQARKHPRKDTPHE